MSKAFTKESDADDEEVIPRASLSILAGGKNYMTVDGERKLRGDLRHLVEVTRPDLVSADKEQNRRQLQLLDQRIATLAESLESAEIVSPPEIPDGIVRFGATVVVRDAAGAEFVYRIVGARETDFDRGWVSWMSPIAKALLTHAEGDRVRFKLPSGEQELAIISVSYG